MKYQALYRKFRPPVWEDVKGQDHIVTTLRNQLKSGRIGHAYLFSGTRGTGKTSVAKLFARAVNCKNLKNCNPCGECASCRAALAGNSMNIIEMDAASNNGVDNAREIVEDMAYSPVDDSYRIYIIDEAHMLSPSAFNALLKTLEEPPSYAMFIFATTEAHRILPTILSRCQRYDFHRLSSDVIAARLAEVAKKEEIDIEERALAYLARLADGALRDGLSLLDQCAAFYEDETLTLDRVLDVLGAADTTVFYELTDALYAGDAAGAIRILDGAFAEGRDLSRFVGDFIWYLRNLMLAQTAGDVSAVLDLSTENLEQLSTQAARLNQQTVMRFIRVFSETQAALRYDTQKRTLLEMALIRACRPSAETGAAALEERIRALEAQEDRMLRALKKIESGTLAAPAPPELEAKPAPPVLPQALPEDVKSALAAWDICLNAFGGDLRAALTMKPKPKLTVTEDGQLQIVVHTPSAMDIVSAEEGLAEVERALEERTGKHIPVSVRHEPDEDVFEEQIPDLSGLIAGMDITEEDA